MDAAHRGATALSEQAAAGEGASPIAPVVQMQQSPTQVSNSISDGPYGWTSRYQVSFTESECRLVIRIRVVPGEGVTPEQVQTAQQRAQREFRNIWDNRFRLTERGTGKVYTVRTSLSFVDSGEHLVVNLRPGRGRASLDNWYVQSSSDITYAHELGHQLGLKDEYIDPRVPDRARADSPGVHTDHSIMGNYHGEGAASAAPRLRHGQTMAGHIGAATERQFDTSMVPREE